MAGGSNGYLAVPGEAPAYAGTDFIIAGTAGLPPFTSFSTSYREHWILAQNNGAPCVAFLDLRWNRPEGANRMIKFSSHALNSRAHRD